MPSPAVTPNPDLWKMLLLAASLAALGVSTLAYLGDETSFLPVRLMMVVLMPVVMVGGGFRAGQLR